MQVVQELEPQIDRTKGRVTKCRTPSVLLVVQVESGMAVQELKPQIEEIKKKYGEDKQAIQREQSALYEKAGVNPLAGVCRGLWLSL